MKEKFKDIAEVANLLKIIANEKRLMILCLINQKEISVNDLAKFVNLSQSALSQHLALMREHGFVKTRRKHHTVFYSLASKEIKDIIKVLHKHYCSCKDE